MDPQLHRLDELAKAIIQRKPGALRAASVLSTGEQLYVYLAANREDKLRARGDTVAQALARIGPYWVLGRTVNRALAVRRLPGCTLLRSGIRRLISERAQIAETVAMTMPTGPLSRLPLRALRFFKPFRLWAHVVLSSRSRAFSVGPRARVEARVDVL